MDNSKSNLNTKRLIKEFLDKKVDINNNYADITNYLDSISKLISDNNFELNIDEAIEFINSSDNLNQVIDFIYKENRKKIEKKGLEALNLDSTILNFLQAYFVINNIVLLV